MTKQKNSINITPDDELLALIDQEAKNNMRTRKAQVEYIVKEYFDYFEKRIGSITAEDLLKANLLETVGNKQEKK